MKCTKAMLEKYVDLTNKTLKLNYCDLTAVDIPLLCEYLNTNPEITTLDLSINHIGVEGAKILAANTTLTTLILYGAKIGTECAQIFAANTSLTTLDIGWNCIESEGVQALAANSTLTTLDIRSNKLDELSAQTLATNTSLTALNLRNNRIGPEGAQALAGNITLKTLDIGWNHIGEKGVSAFVANTTLTSLSIQKSDIRKEGAIALAANTTLKSLDLRSNSYIGEEGLNALLANTSLTALDLDTALIGNYRNQNYLKIRFKNNYTLVKLNMVSINQPEYAWIGKILTRNKIVPWLETIRLAQLMSQAQRSPNCPLGTIPAEVAGLINNYLHATNHYTFFIQQYYNRPNNKDLNSALQQAKLGNI